MSSVDSELEQVSDIIAKLEMAQQGQNLKGDDDGNADAMISSTSATVNSETSEIVSEPTFQDAFNIHEKDQAKQKITHLKKTLQQLKDKVLLEAKSVPTSYHDSNFQQ